MKMKKKEKPSEDQLRQSFPKWGGGDDDKRLDTSYAFYIH